MDGITDGQTEGRTEGWMDEWTNRTHKNYISLQHTLYAGDIKKKGWHRVG